MLSAGRRGDRSEREEEPCPTCKKPSVGASTTGSDNVLINHRPALRVLDKGLHDEGCPEGAWEAREGAPAVLINSRNAHRLSDAASHPSGPGKLLEGSHNVLIGNRVEGGAEDDPGSAAHTHEGGFLVLDEDGEPLVDAPYLIRTAAGKTYRGRTDGRGHTKLVFTRNAEDIEIELLDEGEECAS